MTSRIDTYEQLVIATLEILIVIAKNSRKMRKLLEKKTRPVRKQSTET